MKVSIEQDLLVFRFRGKVLAEYPVAAIEALLKQQSKGVRR